MKQIITYRNTKLFLFRSVIKFFAVSFLFVMIVGKIQSYHSLLEKSNISYTCIDMPCELDTEKDDKSEEDSNKIESDIIPNEFVSLINFKNETKFLVKLNITKRLFPYLDITSPPPESNLI